MINEDQQENNSTENNINQEVDKNEVTTEKVVDVSNKTTKKKLPKANSLGTLAKRQNFVELLYEIKELDKSENELERVKFYTRPEGDFPSEMDKLLISIIKNLKPKEEEESINVNQQPQNNMNTAWGAGSNNAGNINVGGINIGSPIAPPVGANQPNQNVSEKFKEVFPVDLKRTKEDIPQEALDCISHLLKNGVNPNICTQAGMNAVLMSASLNNEEPLLLLLNNTYEERDSDWKLVSYKGAIEHEDVLGNDLLSIAVLNKAFYMADYLTENMDFDINKKYLRMNNQTLLHMVSERFSYKVEMNPLKGVMFEFDRETKEDSILYLIEKNIDANVRCINGFLAAELIPEKNEDTLDEYGKISVEEEQAWERSFNMIKELRNNQKALKEANRKLNF